MCRKYFLPVLASIIYVTVATAQPKVGDRLPAWEEGYLDIHHINTGKGDATFLIFPDATTMLIDAGASNRPPSPREMNTVPNDSLTPGKWISLYILNFLNTESVPKLNYILLTHFHEDHMGGTHMNNERSKSGEFELSGVTEVGENIRFDKLIDRDWPSYNFPFQLENKSIQNYKKFLQWHITHNNSTVEKILVGSNEQIKPMNNPEGYPEFEIRNLAANGYAWTGVNNNVRNYFPPVESFGEDVPNENMLSIALRISYGKFDYFTGGDMTGNPSPGSPKWQDMETPVSQVVGPVEINVTNHHGHFDSQNENFISALRPRVHIIQSWVVNHPAPSTLSRLLSAKLYPGPRDVFMTNLMEETKVFIGSAINRVVNEQGHIVVRVNRGGESFMVYVLDDSNQDYIIKSIHGPYSCE